MDRNEMRNWFLERVKVSTELQKARDYSVSLSVDAMDRDTYEECVRFGVQGVHEMTPIELFNDLTGDDILPDTPENEQEIREILEAVFELESLEG